MAEVAFFDLRTLAVRIAGPEKDKTDDPADRHRALALAWSIVDQADLLRDLIVSETGNVSLEAAETFLDLARPIRDVRNWMRHIPQRVGNYLTLKQAVPPILGAVSFTALRRWIGELENDGVPDAQVIEYHAIVLVNTRFERDGAFEGEPIKYERFRVPVDHFVLQAFGFIIHLDLIVSAMSALCDAFGASVGRWADQKIKDLIREGGVAENAEAPMSEHGAGTYRMVARRGA
jgi:hypothetical protein